MTDQGAVPRRFKPITLGIMFFTLGLAIRAAGEFTELDQINTIIMYCSLAISIILLVAFFFYLVPKFKAFFDNVVRRWMYFISTIYLFGFTINWLLNIGGGSTDLAFHLVFGLGFLWFSILTIVLYSSLPSNIKYMAAGIFIGSGIPSIYSQNYVVLLFLCIVGIIMFLLARKGWDLTEHFPL